MTGISDIRLFYPEAAELQLAPENVYAAMGYKDGQAPGQVTDLTPELISDAANHLKPVAVFRIFDSSDIHIEKGRITVQDKPFDIQKIIWSQIRRSESFAFFIVSLGKSFDAWVHSFYHNEDAFSAYIGDTIGSEYAEKLADWLQDKIETEAGEQGLHITNRFSPGYCGWSVREQHALFSFFPDFSDVTLTDSALMNPVKSVSGLIGIGADVQKQDYFCNICDAKDCYKRR